MAEGAGSREQFVPARYQPPLPIDRLILRDGSAGAMRTAAVARAAPEGSWQPSDDEQYVPSR